MKKVLLTATVQSHIAQFHRPLAEVLHEHGYAVHVAARNNLGEKNGLKLDFADKVFDVPFSRSPKSMDNVIAYFRLKEILEKESYTVIHCNTPMGGIVTRLAAVKARRHGARVLYTAHGFHFYKGAPLLNWLIYYPVERFCARYTDKLVTINKEDYERAKQFKMRKNGKVYYVPGVGINLEKIQNLRVDIKQKKAELGISEKTPVLLSVGELIKRKNHESVLNALSRIKDKDFVYLICGRGVLMESLQSLTKHLGIENKVKFLGFRKDIAEICKTADLFIFPSYQEGLPVALMEAIAAGLPVIASNVRGNRDLIDKENLFEPDDVAALTSLIENELDAIEGDGSKKVNYTNLEQYSLKNVLKQMAEIYEAHIVIK